MELHLFQVYILMLFLKQQSYIFSMMYHYDILKTTELNIFQWYIIMIFSKQQSYIFTILHHFNMDETTYLRSTAEPLSDLTQTLSNLRT